MHRKTILDILLDETNTDPIVLTDIRGRQITWEQIAVIPYHETVYAILKPMQRITGIADDEAIVFKVTMEGPSEVLAVETDETVARMVFDEYYRLLDSHRLHPDSEG